MKLTILLFGVLFCAPCWAQHFEQLPDFRAAYDADRVVIIPEGEIVAMPSGDIDLLWIEGTCVAPRDADLELTVSEIVVTPTGRLDMGTKASPVFGKITVTFADGDFIADDGGQWGHGLLVFGDITCWGAPKDAWSEGGDGLGWAAGDRIRYADLTPQIGPDRIRYRQDGKPGGSNDVSSSLAANFSQSITFESENPSGTRGHTLYSDFANVSIGHTAFIGLGRTRPAAIGADNITGRYPVHFHHCKGSTKEADSIAVDGLDYSNIWNIVVHATNDATIKDSVAHRAGGAGVACEDGTEVGNTFDGILSFDNNAGATRNIGTGTGFSGAGFWFRSMAQHINNCVGVNNHHGFQSAVTIGKPSDTIELAPEDGPSSLFQTTLSGKNNRFICNTLNGYDAWGSRIHTTFRRNDFYALPIHWEDSVFAYNGRNQVQHTFRESASAFTNCSFIGSNNPTQATYGNRAVINYDRLLYFDRCDFSNLTYGTMTGRGTIISECIFDTEVGILYASTEAQGWPFGVTDSDNIFTGEPREFRYSEHFGTEFEDIKEHEVTLAEVYANIAAFRAEYGGGGGDPNAEERQRIEAEIAELEAQIAGLMITIAELEARLSEL